MSYRRITVTASTIGQANPAGLEERKNYRWNGDPDKSEAARAGALVTRRAGRIRRFAEILAEFGHDPWTAPDPDVIEAGGRVGVGAQTARDYRNELKRRQIHDGEVRDA